MYSSNESLAYTHWLTGDDAVLPHIRWVVTAHETNDEPTRWSPEPRDLDRAPYRLPPAGQHGGLRGVRRRRLPEPHRSASPATSSGTRTARAASCPAGRVDGGLYHQGSSTATATAWWRSSWMTVLTVDAMVRAYAVRRAPRSASSFCAWGPSCRPATKVDADHDYEPRRAPRLSRLHDGGGRQQQRARRLRGGARAWTWPCAVAWAAYFGELLGSPDATLVAARRRTSTTPTTSA